MFSYMGKRYDGVKKPDFPAKGERDLWLVSRHYLRKAFVGVGNDQHLRYFGVLVGLFSDGKVEVKSPNQLIGIRLASNAWVIQFPDQTGIPPNASASVNDVTDSIARSGALRARESMAAVSK